MKARIFYKVYGVYSEPGFLLDFKSGLGGGNKSVGFLSAPEQHLKSIAVPPRKQVEQWEGWIPDLELSGLELPVPKSFMPKTAHWH